MSSAPARRDGIRGTSGGTGNGCASRSVGVAHRLLRAAAAVPLVAAVVAGAPGASWAAPTARVLSHTTLDGSGLYFVSYDGLVNVESFQQDGILTYKGHQYAAWYRSNRNAVVARRSLPSGAWQSVELPHALSTNDSHNVISLGISPSDGRVHIAMDTHNSQVFYVKSVAGLASDPASVPWAASQFGAVQRTLDGVSLGNITYPQFLVSPQGRLQLSYRTGGSGNGANVLAEYAGSWSVLGPWTSATGDFTYNGVTSTTRNMYLHGLTYAGTRLHATFTWREGNTRVLCNSGGLHNHDTGYVYSDDHGRTWRNGAGTVVGSVSGGQKVSISSPGLVVDPLSVDHGLMNQESQAVDASGLVHAAISYVPGRFTQCVTSYAADRAAHGYAFHLYRTASGAWTKMEIPVALGSTGRSQIFLDRSDTVYVVLPFGRVVAATKATGWTDWTTVYAASDLGAFGEVVIDRARLATESVLSIMYQQRSSGTTPSAVRVVDLQLGG